MPTVDWGLLVNWIITGAVGLVFGVIGGYATYRFDRKRDDLRWQREKLNLKDQWEYDKEQLEIAWKQKLQELEIQHQREQQTTLRKELTRGLDSPSRAIKAMSEANSLRFYPVYEKIPAGGFGSVGYDGYDVGKTEVTQIIIEGQPHCIINLASSRPLNLLRREYAIVKAYGDSMNLVGINDGDYVLLYCPPTNIDYDGDVLANNGDIVVAEFVTPLESEATIKRFWRRGDKVVLEPCSDNPIHKSRVITQSDEGFHIRAIALAVLKAIPSPDG